MAATETYTPRLKQRYNDELRAELREQLELESIMQSPTVDKITLNMGVGEGKTDARRSARRASRSHSSRSARACRSASR
jgi:ribosomal protein L5